MLRFDVGSRTRASLLPVTAMQVGPAAQDDAAAIEALLLKACLPIADLGTAPIRMWVAREKGLVVGAVGLERHGPSGLLRSLIVDPAQRRHGLAQRLVSELEREAEAAGLESLVLLTQTAQAFFERSGYAVVDRASTPAPMQQSAEFKSLCPASAVCMMKSFRPATTEPSRG